MIRSVAPKWMPVCWRHCANLLALLMLLGSLGGCSLGVMAGKAIWGDPKTPSEFRNRTGADLTKGDKTLLVVVQTPQSVESELPSLNLDLIDAITRRLKLHGVKVVEPDQVAKWIDTNGGHFDHPTELAQRFEADFIAVIDVEKFTFHDATSPNLYHGEAAGQVQVYEVHSAAGAKQAQQVFGANFRNEYPPHGPVPVDQLSPKMFQKRFIDNLSERLGSRFYDYRIGDEF
jgi:hypothetical protein